MKKAGATVPELPKPARPPLESFLTPEDREAFQKRADEWLSDPAKVGVRIQAWFMGQQFLYLQVLDKLALNPPAGRSGPMMSVHAIKDIREQVITFLKLIKESKA